MQEEMEEDTKKLFDMSRCVHLDHAQELQFLTKWTS